MSDISKINIQAYDKAAKEYDDFARGFDFSNEYQQFKEYLGKEEGNILDVGCGGGRDARAIFDLGYDVFIIDDACAASPEDVGEILAIHELLDHLADSDPDTAELVKLRYFVGFTVAEAAEALGVSPRKAHLMWSYARSWFHRELSRGSGGE